MMKRPYEIQNGNNVPVSSPLIPTPFVPYQCPARFRDTVGGYFLFEYEDQDYSIAAGRELWGYPKKYADILMTEETGKVTAKAVKNKKETMRLELDLTEENGWARVLETIV